MVPTIYRSEILNLDHEMPMSGHLGVNKTLYKILKHFYWSVNGNCFKLLQALSYSSGGREL